MIPPRATAPASGFSQGEMPGVLERYELKYTIPLEWVDPIIDFIGPYCYPDAYSARCEDGFYRVNNLYLDSPELVFLNTKMCGANRRFNMRVRTYGDAPELPYFAEIKHKSGDTIRKTRGVIREADLEQVLRRDPRVGDDPRLAQFQTQALLYNVQPWVQTRYRRKAYISHCDDYARVTFDVGLEYAPRDVWDPLPVAGDMAPSDGETLFDPGTNVILELKCYTSYVPSWMIDLIRTFGLRRRGFSKFAAGMLPTLQRMGMETGYYEAILME